MWSKRRLVARRLRVFKEGRRAVHADGGPTTRTVRPTTIRNARGGWWWWWWRKRRYRWY